MRARVVPVLLVALLPLAAATPAHAASGVNISKISFDSPGSDTGSNSSLNAEYVVLKNYGTDTKDLTGWTVVDKANHRYTFGSFRLAGGASVTVHTGSGTNTSSHRYWGQGWYVWNNTGDTAYLLGSGGSEKDRCSYDGSGSSVSC